MCSVSLRGAFYATKQSQKESCKAEIASQRALAMTLRLLRKERSQ